MDATGQACWADPLTRTERACLRRRLAHACRRLWDTYPGTDWLEMADLHLDVTERAETPAR